MGLQGLQTTQQGATIPYSLKINHKTNKYQVHVSGVSLQKKVRLKHRNDHSHKEEN